MLVCWSCLCFCACLLLVFYCHIGTCFFFVISVPVCDAFACFSRFSLAWCLINFPCQLWLFWNCCVDACVLLSCRSTTLILSLMLIPMFAEIDMPMLAYFFSELYTFCSVRKSNAFDLHHYSLLLPINTILFCPWGLR